MVLFNHLLLLPHPGADVIFCSDTKQESQQGTEVSVFVWPDTRTVHRNLTRRSCHRPNGMKVDLLGIGHCGESLRDLDEAAKILNRRTK